MMLHLWRIIGLIQHTLIVTLVFGQVSGQVSPLKSNVAVYWGQGPSQKRLLYYCQQSTIDTIILSFIHVFPQQGNGFPGSNFGNQCSGSTYNGPGNDPSMNQLQSSCPYMAADIPVCQRQYGKKIILSLGGGTNTYQLTGGANGIAFANFLWGAFGPQTASWLNSGKPRPFDGPNHRAVVVDGFDFDIEHPSTDNSEGYIALIKHLRALFPARSKYLISGSPQCIVPDANMARMISQAKFDILYIQFYNTPSCSARSFWDANPFYKRTHLENPSGFSASYEAWSKFLIGTSSSNAKIYIGLPGSKRAVWDPNFYVPSKVVAQLVRAYFCKKEFGGVAIWEATYADENRVGDRSGNFYQYVKRALVKLAQDKTLSCYGK